MLTSKFQHTCRAKPHVISGWWVTIKQVTFKSFLIMKIRKQHPSQIYSNNESSDYGSVKYIQSCTEKNKIDLYLPISETLGLKRHVWLIHVLVKNVSSVSILLYIRKNNNYFFNPHFKEYIEGVCIFEQIKVGYH